MRDPIREQDIERTLSLRGQHVEVHVADDGRCTVRLTRDQLDDLIHFDHPALHEDCVDSDDAYERAKNAERAGYNRALSDVKRLAGDAA